MLKILQTHVLSHGPSKWFQDNSIQSVHTAIFVSLLNPSNLFRDGGLRLVSDPQPQIENPIMAKHAIYCPHGVSIGLYT